MDWGLHRHDVRRQHDAQATYQTENSEVRFVLQKA